MNIKKESEAGNQQYMNEDKAEAMKLEAFMKSEHIL